MDNSVILEQLIIVDDVTIPQGRNSVIYINKEIEIKAQIICEGSLVFENCVIKYKPFENKKRILLKENSDIKIINCNVIGITEGRGIATSYISFLESGKNIDEWELNEEICNTVSFIEYENHYDKCNLEISNSFFIDCSSFAKIFSSTVRDSIFEYSTKEIAVNSLYVNSESSSSILNCLIKFSGGDNNIKISDFSNLIFESDVIDDEIKNKYLKLSSETDKTKIILSLLYNNIQKKISCISNNDFYFYLISSIVKEAIFYGFKDISYTTFNGVSSVIGEFQNIKSSKFINCVNILSSILTISIDDCVFENCRQKIINSTSYSHNLYVNNCNFFNICTRGSVGIYGPNGKSKGRINNCIFNGLDVDSSFIESGNNGGFDGQNVTVENCTFKNWITKNDADIISKNKVSIGLFNWKEVPSVKIENCIGLDNTYQTGKTDFVPKEYKDKNGDFIGSNLDESKVGVSTYI